MIAEKELLLSEIRKKINPKSGFIVAGYKSMSANMTADFRNQLVLAGGDFFVLKKRILLKIASELHLQYELSELAGHVGLVVVNDNFVSTTKAVYAFKDANKDVIEVLGGHFEGKKCTPKQVEEISKLPSIEVMRSQFLGLLEAPMSQTLATFEALLTSVIYCLDNKSKNES